MNKSCFCVASACTKRNNTPTICSNINRGPYIFQCSLEGDIELYRAYIGKNTVNSVWFSWSSTPKNCNKVSKICFLNKIFKVTFCPANFIFSAWLVDWILSIYTRQKWNEHNKTNNQQIFECIMLWLPGTTRMSWRNFKTITID